MSFFDRLFGPPAGQAAPTAEPAAAAGPEAAAETATVRKIVAKLESLPPERARLLASAAYILARAAESDMSISDQETAFMERILVERGLMSEAESVIVIEIAKQQARLFGSTEDYLVTREFLRLATPAERLAVLRGCFLVTAADESIVASESATLNQIASELQVSAEDLAALRAEFGDRLSVVQAMRAAQGS
ncbi:MAG: TerB family tellurite resistance protein [Chloroflexi bacterium]|jgi:uncharacterized tellurite resistance protein B-like protein|nr:TerB family tellurite resistance protein [Chloroflexota bacterium]